MYNLILVDDEQIVLNGIQTVFRLEDYGFHIVGTYTNPQSALDQLNDTNPDLIITDIKMPQMDGLAFSIKVKEQLPDTEIVILSGYDDFAFAQTAIHIGVTDYLLKPIKKQTFEKMLVKVEKRIRTKYASNEEYEILSQTILNNLPFIKNRFFLDLINGRKDEAYYEQQYDSLGLTFLSHPYVLIKFIFKHSLPEHKHDTLFRRAADVFTDALKACGYTEIFYTDEYICSLLYEINCDLSEVKEKICHAISQFYSETGIMCTAAISKPHRGFRKFIIANMECDASLLRSFTREECVLSADTDEIAHTELTLPGVKLENLSLAISLHEEQQITEILNDLFTSSSENIAGADYFYSIALIVLLKLFDIQQNLHLDHEPVKANEISIRFLKNHYKSTQALREFLAAKITLLTKGSLNKKDVRLSKITNNAIQYIQKHYTEDISLSDIADHTYVSKNYLCHIFKKEMNTTLLNYLTDTRIQKAKTLVKEGKAKMYEIAQRVGYHDYAYFSQIFKRHTGITLSEYKNSL